MLNKILRLTAIPLVSAFIVLSSLMLNKAYNHYVLFIFALLFVSAMVLYKRTPVPNLLKIVFLAGFHWASQLNWCELLYFIVIILTLQNRPEAHRSVSLSFGYALLYSMIRFSYVPSTSYNLLVSVYDLISFLLIVVIFQYMFQSELQKKRLQRRNHFLVTHDPLTGLLNYESYIKAIRELTEQKNSNFILVLLDFQDFKSINKESIKNGNDILTKISLIIRAYFSTATAISRYAGDRFALMVHCHENTLLEIEDVLNSGTLGYEVTFSTAVYPDESSDAQGIISLAEDRLFQKKRLIWIKREEEMFRTEKLKIVGELAAGMAHEIRNPLTTLQGFIHLSKSHDYNIKPWIDIITNEITRMSELTAEFLQFSKPHISNMKAESICKCIDRMLSLTESQVASKGHYIVVKNVKETVLVQMDRNKIVQVLLNLVKNAIEAMQKPGTIKIEAERINNHVMIEISDTGSGIPETELEKIFNPFYSTKQNGTGLGLSICQKIIQDHDGTLSIQSTLGEGSIFSVRLPVFSEN
jgi:diguanylate cyclase (GGDEF)-like protein